LWLTSLPFVILLAPGWLPWVAAIVLGLIPFLGVAVAVTYRPSRRAWMQPLMMLLNSLAGAFAVAVTVFHHGFVDTSIGSTIVVAFFGFGILRIRPLRGLP
jgi:hypothetical protein